MQEHTPLVSICTLTYNHAPYLKEFFNGILCQKTDFPFELIINDDCSNDGTQEILREYECKHPDIIKVIYHSENLYSKGERDMLIKYCYPRCKGKYVAYCESDDFWTDPYKLQKQVDYLESHEDCVLVHTDMDVQDASSGELVMYGKWKKLKNFNQIGKDFAKKLIPYILQGKYSVSTLTVCARLAAVKEVCEQYDFEHDDKLIMGDTPLWVALASKGKFHYIPDVTSVYRVLSESASHSNNYDRVFAFYKSCLYMVEKMSNLFDVSDTDRNIAIQEYLYFIIQDMYNDRQEYIPLLYDTIPESIRFTFCNSLLLKTMNSPKIIKKFVSLFVRTNHLLSHRLHFYFEKIIAK